MVAGLRRLVSATVLAAFTEVPALSFPRHFSCHCVLNIHESRFPESHAQGPHPRERAHGPSRMPVLLDTGFPDTVGFRHGAERYPAASVLPRLGLPRLP